MIAIPYVKQPDKNSCALASYTMVAKHFFPETTLEEMAKISDWQPGYVVWAFKFWLWIMARGIKITEYDTLDYRAWAKEGLEGLKRSVPEKELNFYVENTKNLESYSEDIQKVLAHPNFTLIKEKPSFQILEKALNESKVCEVVLDSRSLRGAEGFSLHRVVVLDVGNNEIEFHDPARDPNTKVDVERFKHSWLEVLSESELCIYGK